VRKDESAPEPGDGLRRADGLGRKRGIFRIVKFALASGVGFLIAEGILILGVLALYHTTKVPGINQSSLAVLGMDVLAFGVGVTAAFVINERVTVRGQARGRASWLVRWGKYQLAALLGNVLIVVVQLALLATLSLAGLWERRWGGRLLPGDVRRLDVFCVEGPSPQRLVLDERCLRAKQSFQCRAENTTIVTRRAVLNSRTISSPSQLGVDAG